MARHFGKEIIGKAMKLPPEDPKVEMLWLKLYKVEPLSWQTAASLPTNHRNLSKPSMRSTMAYRNILPMFSLDTTAKRIFQVESED
jgi:hypothetical protein